MQGKDKAGSICSSFAKHENLEMSVKQNYLTSKLLTFKHRKQLRLCETLTFFLTICKHSYFVIMFFNLSNIHNNNKDVQYDFLVNQVTNIKHTCEWWWGR